MINAKPFPSFIVCDSDHFVFSPSSQGNSTSWQQQLILRLSVGGQESVPSPSFPVIHWGRDVMDCGRSANIMFYMNLCFSHHPSSQPFSPPTHFVCIGRQAWNIIGLLLPFHLLSFVMNNFPIFLPCSIKIIAEFRSGAACEWVLKAFQLPKTIY